MREIVGKERNVMMNHEYEKQTLKFVISRNAYPLYDFNLKLFIKGIKHANEELILFHF